MVAVEEISLRIVDVAAEPRSSASTDRMSQLPASKRIVTDVSSGSTVTEGASGRKSSMKTPSLQTGGQQRLATIADRRISKKDFPHYVGKYNEKSGACYPFFPAAADFMACTDVSQPPAIPVRNHPAAQRHSRR